MRLSPWVSMLVLVAGCAGRASGDAIPDAETDASTDTDEEPGTEDTDAATDTDLAVDTETAVDTDVVGDTDAVGDTDVATDTDADTDDTDTDASAVCGDGLVTRPEECDDQHDIIPYDGCTGCRVDNGWWCYGEPSYCVVL